MKYAILIACECSQVERNAFASMEIETWSADLQPCYGGFPSWHYKGDMFDLIAKQGRQVVMEDGTLRCVPKWGMVIAHPPCTYLAQVGAAVRAYRDDEIGVFYRSKMNDAANFFMRCWSIDVPLLAVENPRPSPLARLPRHTWICYPDLFGSRWTKRTHWWLRGLPPLLPMMAANPRRSSATANRRGQKRSESFPEVANAMAMQWGDIFKKMFNNYK